MRTPIKIIIIEDNAVFRHAITSAINKEDGFECIAKASTSEEAFNLLKKQNLSPDIILLDLEMPGTHGLDALPKLKELAPSCHVIVLTQSGKEVHILMAITRGASGYLLKTATLEEIYQSIREVSSGGATLDPNLAHVTLDLIRRIQPVTHEGHDELLTARELEVLQLLSEGYVKKEIADQLDLSVHAIDKRMRRVYNKLQVQNVASAVASALRKGWI
jgi:DNA-binding NarL/FixJ family response regulator